MYLFLFDLYLKRNVFSKYRDQNSFLNASLRYLDLDLSRSYIFNVFVKLFTVFYLYIYIYIYIYMYKVKL